MRNIVIDGDKLRRDLVDYFGTAMFNSSPMAMFELEKVQRAGGDELIQIALDNGFDLSEYE
jgi:hypothetical protein